MPPLTFSKRVAREAKVSGDALQGLVHHPASSPSRHQISTSFRWGQQSDQKCRKRGREGTHAPGVVSEEERCERGDADMRQGHAPRWPSATTASASAAAVRHSHCGNGNGNEKWEMRFKSHHELTSGERNGGGGNRAAGYELGVSTSGSMAVSLDGTRL
jgi:hypothetical protein